MAEQNKKEISAKANIEADLEKNRAELLNAYDFLIQIEHNKLAFEEGSTSISADIPMHEKKGQASAIKKRIRKLERAIAVNENRLNQFVN